MSVVKDWINEPNDPNERVERELAAADAACSIVGYRALRPEEDYEENIVRIARNSLEKVGHNDVRA